MKDSYHTKAGEKTALIFQGRPDGAWGPRTGYLWEYKLPGTDEWIPLSQERLEVLHPSTNVQIDGTDARIDIDNPWYDDQRVTTLVIEKTPAELDGTQFRVTIGRYDQKQSVVATLNVGGGIKIDAKAVDGMAFEGQKAELSVDTKAPSVTYQWFKGEPAAENKIEGAAGKILTFENAAQDDAGTYAVVVSGGGKTETVTANLTVFEQPSVSPKNAAVGSEIKFSVNASSDYTCQWYKGKPGVGTPVGEGGNIFTIDSADAGSDGEYYVSVTKTGDADNPVITSNAIELNIASLTAQPKDTYAFAGQAASFDVTAPDGADLTEYQWYKGTPESKTVIENAVSAKLLFDSESNPVEKSDEGTYFVTVSQTFGTGENAETVVMTSKLAKLIVFELTCSNNTISAGEDVTLTVTGGEQQTERTLFRAYAWYKNDGNGWEQIDGASKRTYERHGVSGAENGTQFFVRMMVDGFILDSGVLTLTVYPEEDDSSTEDNTTENNSTDSDGNSGVNRGSSSGHGEVKILPQNQTTNPEPKTITTDAANETVPVKQSNVAGLETTTPEKTYLWAGAAAAFAIVCLFLLLVFGRKKRKEEDEK
ncbi:hypothetical protein [Methanolapillus africanus]|uniref:hypothetical protein n=1 Tax=Methanolapillus africanus TaxID=3028297 RepID=UPI0030B8F4E7